MNFLKTTGVILAVLAGTSAPSAVASHYATRKEIGDLVKDDVLSQDGFSSEWTAIQTRLNAQDSKPRTKSLEKIKDISKHNPENGDAIRQWCKEAYGLTFGSFVMPGDFDLLEDVQEFCVYRIKEKIGSNNLFDLEKNPETEKEALKKKLENLKSHQTTHGNLDAELTQLKADVEATKTTEEQNIEKLRYWCKNAYNTPYKGENENEWKLSNYYCNKST